MDLIPKNLNQTVERQLNLTRTDLTEAQLAGMLRAALRPSEPLETASEVWDWACDQGVLRLPYMENFHIPVTRYAIEAEVYPTRGAGPLLRDIEQAEFEIDNTAFGLVADRVARGANGLYVVVLFPNREDLIKHTNRLRNLELRIYYNQTLNRYVMSTRLINCIFE